MLLVPRLEPYNTCAVRDAKDPTEDLLQKEERLEQQVWVIMRHCTCDLCSTQD